MADEEKKEQEQLDQEVADALDWDGAGAEDSLGSYGDEDEPWADDADESKEEQAKEAAEEKEEADAEVATEDDKESSESDDAEEDGAEVDEDGVATFTLDGKKYTAEEIAADPKLLSKMATHYNQVGNFQKLLDEERTNVSARDEQIAQLELEKQKIEREWIARKMAEENKRQQAAAEPAPEPPPRPSTEVLKTQLKPYIEQLHKDGRLTEDEVDEHSGLIAEHIYDYANITKVIQEVAAQAFNRIEQIEQFVNPAIQSWDAEKAVREEETVHQQAAAIEGYEELADPETWESLKKYISDKIAASPKNSDGRPTFDPVFDAETMAEQFDAMQGKTLRKALAEQKKRAEKQQKEDAKRAGGSATTGGKSPKKKPKKKGAPTPHDEALDFGSGQDGRYAG
jgi:hypothetical protein